MYYDWFVTDQKSRKRKLDDSDDCNEIVIKHFKQKDSTYFFGQKLDQIF